MKENKKTNLFDSSWEEAFAVLQRLNAKQLQDVKEVLAQNYNQLIADGHEERLIRLLATIGSIQAVNEIEMGKSDPMKVLEKHINEGISMVDKGNNNKVKLSTNDVVNIARAINDQTFLFHYAVIAMFSLIEHSVRVVRKNMWNNNSKKNCERFEERYGFVKEDLDRSCSAATEFAMQGILQAYKYEYDDNLFATTMSYKICQLMGDCIKTMVNTVEKEAKFFVKRMEKEDREKNGICTKTYKTFNARYVAELCAIREICAVMNVRCGDDYEALRALSKYVPNNNLGGYNMRAFLQLANAATVMIEEAVGGKNIAERCKLYDISDKAIGKMGNDMYEKDKIIKSQGYEVVAEAQFDYMSFFVCKIAFDTMKGRNINEDAKRQIRELIDKHYCETDKTSMEWASFMKDVHRLVRGFNPNPEDEEDDQFCDLRDYFKETWQTAGDKYKMIGKFFSRCIHTMSALESWKGNDVIERQRGKLMKFVG